MSRALTLAEKRKRYMLGEDCLACAGLAWRRAKPLCHVCLLPYADEDLTECRREAVRSRPRWVQP